MMPSKIRIGTRKSKLALIQTDMIIGMIQTHVPQMQVEVVTMQTLGDKLLNQSLNEIGGKGVFTQELEQALLAGKIDMAVHSAKDMPLVMPTGVSLYPVGEREDSSDVLVSCKAPDTLGRMVVGTSSLRRSIQIRQIYENAVIKDIRGNVETRLQKLLSGEYDAIILANAGLLRIARKAETGFLEQFYYTRLWQEGFLPAACQGILAIEIRTGEFAELVQALTHEETARSFQVEREFLRVMSGGCNAPCGIHTESIGNQIDVQAFFAREEQTSKNVPKILGESNLEKKCRAWNKIRRVRRRISDLSEIKEIVALLKFGEVSLVGAGIGSEKNLTLHALEKIKEADCIVYDKLLAPSILNEAKPGAELIYVGKSFAKHSMSQDEINTLLVDLAKSGKDVVRLKGGDPFVFGRGSEEALCLKKEGIAFEVIPGISSCIAVPQHVGIPVSHRGMARSFSVITGHEFDGNTGVDESIAKQKGTLVFLMGLHNAKRIADDLMRFGKDAQSMVAVISNGISAKERVFYTRLKDLERVVQKEQVQTPCIIVVGDVVGIGKELAVGGSNAKNECRHMAPEHPLFGKSVLMTGTRSMVSKLLPQIQRYGGEGIAMSLIETVYEPSADFERAMRDLHAYTYLIFTSSNGIEAFFRYIREQVRLEGSFDQRSLAHLKFAVIGEGSRDTLRSYGYVEDFMPSAYTSIALADELLPRLGEEDNILIIRAKEANPYLTQALEKVNLRFTDAYIYCTHVDRRRIEELHRVLSTVDYVTLASPSAVNAWFEMMGNRKNPQDVKIASIGPETTKACERLGIHVDITARVCTAKGLVQAIARDVRKEKKYP